MHLNHEACQNDNNNDLKKKERFKMLSNWIDWMVISYIATECVCIKLQVLNFVYGYIVHPRDNQ